MATSPSVFAMFTPQCFTSNLLFPTRIPIVPTLLKQSGR
uniref:Uncharacterized protein n=1 Tax=Anguilla anguilla TaxID=7936 RepID=A0A0E9R157_ANGAN